MMVAPAFQHRRVSAYAAVFASYAERAQAEWPDGAIIDIAQEMTRLTLAIVAKTLLDAELAGEADELGQALTIGMRYTVDKFSAIMQVPSNWPTPANRRFRRARA